MKKTLRIALACAFGASLVFAGCTKDFSSDISKLDSRVTAIEQEDLANKLAALTSTVNTLDGTLKTAQSDIKTLQSTVAQKADASQVSKDIATAIAGLKSTLEAADKNLETSLKALIDKKADASELTAKYKELITKLGEKWSTADGQKAVNELKTALEAKIKANSDEIAANKAEIAAINGKITDIYSKISALQAKDVELTEADAQLARDLAAAKAALEQRDKELTDLLKALGTKVDNNYAELDGRIRELSACAPKANGVEVERFYFKSAKLNLDKSVVTMRFNVSPAQYAAKVTKDNAKLVVTEGAAGITRGTTAEPTLNNKTYYAIDEITYETNGVVVAKTRINSKVTEANGLWVSLQVADAAANEGGAVEILSAPVMAQEGNAFTLTGKNLAWFRGDVKVSETASNGEFQIIGENGPKFFSAVDKVVYRDLIDKTVKDASYRNAEYGNYPDVYASAKAAVKPLEVKVSNFEGTSFYSLSYLEEKFGLDAGTLAVAFDNAANWAYAPSANFDLNNLPEAGSGDLDLFTTTGSALNVDAKVAYPVSEAYDTFTEIYDAVGTSFVHGVGYKYADKTLTKVGSTIGGKVFADLIAYYRSELVGYDSWQGQTIKNSIKPQTVVWNYLDWEKTNPDRNGFFQDLDWYDWAEASTLGELNGMKAPGNYGAFVAAVTPVTKNTAVWFTQVKSNVTNFQVEAYPYATKAVDYTATWQECDKNASGVNVNTITTQAQFTVGPKPVGIALGTICTVDPFSPNQSDNNTVKFNVNYVDKIYAAQSAATWVGTLTGDDAKVATVKAAIKAAFENDPTVTPVGKLWVSSASQPAVTNSDYQLTFNADNTISVVFPKAKHLLNTGAYQIKFEKVIFGIKVTFDVKFSTKLTETYKIKWTLVNKNGDEYAEHATASLAGQVVNLAVEGDHKKHNHSNDYAYTIQDPDFNQYFVVEGVKNQVDPVKKNGVATVHIDIERASGLAQEKDIYLWNCEHCALTANGEVGIINDNVTATWNKGLYNTNEKGWFNGQPVNGEITNKVKITLRDESEQVLQTKTLTLATDEVMSIYSARQVIDVPNMDDEDSFQIDLLKGVKIYGKLPYKYDNSGRTNALLLYYSEEDFDGDTDQKSIYDNLPGWIKKLLKEEYEWWQKYHKPYKPEFEEDQKPEDYEKAKQLLSYRWLSNSYYMQSTFNFITPSYGQDVLTADVKDLIKVNTIKVMARAKGESNFYQYTFANDGKIEKNIVTLKNNNQLRQYFISAQVEVPTFFGKYTKTVEAVATFGDPANFPEVPEVLL